MPRPHPGIKNFTKYMRDDYPFGKAWTGTQWGSFTALEVKAAIKTLSKLDPLTCRIFNMYHLTKLPRTEIASRSDMNYATVKTYMDRGIKCILNLLTNKDINDEIEQKLNSVRDRMNLL